MTIFNILCSFGTLFHILVSCTQTIWQPWFSAPANVSFRKLSKNVEAINFFDVGFREGRGEEKKPLFSQKKIDDLSLILSCLVVSVSCRQNLLRFETDTSIYLFTLIRWNPFSKSGAW
jgi:hypothetical protein